MSNSSLVDYAEKNNVDKLQALLDAGEYINQFKYNRSALHAACVSNAFDAAKLLINKGINVNLRDNYTGATSLHYCAEYNYFKIANIIIENGGKLDIADNYGNQPLWTAVFNVKGKVEKIPLVELFLKNGADKNHKNNVGKSPLDFATQINSTTLLEILDKW